MEEVGKGRVGAEYRHSGVVEDGGDGGGEAVEGGEHGGDGRGRGERFDPEEHHVFDDFPLRRRGRIINRGHLYGGWGSGPEGMGKVVVVGRGGGGRRREGGVLGRASELFWWVPVRELFQRARRWFGFKRDGT